MPLNVASGQGLHCLPLIQQFLYTSSKSETDLFKFSDKYSKELTLSAPIFRQRLSSALLFYKLSTGNKFICKVEKLSVKQHRS